MNGRWLACEWLLIRVRRAVFVRNLTALSGLSEFREPAFCIQRKIHGMQTNCADAANTAPEVDHACPRLGLLLGSVYRQWRRQVDLSFKDLGLSDATHMPLLVLNVQGEPMRQKDLAEALFLDSSSLVRVLAQLRDAQLVNWSNDPADRRSKRIVLTTQGQQVAARILSKSLEIEQAILADISTSELDTTRSTLRKISQQFDALGSNCSDLNNNR